MLHKVGAHVAPTPAFEKHRLGAVPGRQRYPMTLLFIVGVYAVLALALYIVLLRSPQGYEDERGFHIGRDDAVPGLAERDRLR